MHQVQDWQSNAILTKLQGYFHYTPDKNVKSENVMCAFIYRKCELSSLEITKKSRSSSLLAKIKLTLSSRK